MCSSEFNSRINLHHASLSPLHSNHYPSSKIELFVLLNFLPILFITRTKRALYDVCTCFVKISKENTQNIVWCECFQFPLTIFWTVSQKLVIKPFFLFQIKGNYFSFKRRRATISNHLIFQYLRHEATLLTRKALFYLKALSPGSQRECTKTLSIKIACRGVFLRHKKYIDENVNSREKSQSIQA